MEVVAIPNSSGSLTQGPEELSFAVAASLS
jgi:hypothetical protein